MFRWLVDVDQITSTTAYEPVTHEFGQLSRGKAKPGHLGGVDVFFEEKVGFIGPGVAGGAGANGHDEGFRLIWVNAGGLRLARV